MSEDEASDVGAVVSNRQRPLVYAVAGLVTLWAPGGAEMFANRAFRTDEVKHELLQDKNWLVLKGELGDLKKSSDKRKDVDTKIIKLLMRDLDLLRAQVVKLSHKKERAALRDNFIAQRNNAVELLVEAQKD